jgi:predicted kinase
MVGLPCSGKSTRAKILEKECNALLLTVDKWHIKLFGQDAMDKDHDINHSKIESILLEIAYRALSLGVNVILDYGFWGRDERLFFKKKSEELGVGIKIHFMDVSIEELFKRLEKRNKELSDEAFYIPRDYMEEYIKKFQPPDQDELDWN